MHFSFIVSHYPFIVDYTVVTDLKEVFIIVYEIYFMSVLLSLHYNEITIHKCSLNELIFYQWFSERIFVFVFDNLIQISYSKG